jgi:hypothetical protein
MVITSGPFVEVIGFAASVLMGHCKGGLN